MGLEESTSWGRDVWWIGKLFSAMYLQPQSGRLCSNAAICPHPVLVKIAHGKTPATCFWTPASSIFQSCSCWVPATCRCLLAGETCVPSCVLGMKHAANMIWEERGRERGKCCPVWPQAAAYLHLQCRTMVFFLLLDVQCRYQWSVIYRSDWWVKSVTWSSAEGSTVT